MNKVFGVLGVLLAIFLGLYLGLYLMFFGGIVNICVEVGHIFSSKDVNGFVIAIGIVKVFFASLVGWGSFFLIGAPSFALLNAKRKSNGVEFHATKRR